MDHLLTPPSQGYFVGVEGNIGTGKTSLVAALSAYWPTRRNRPCKLLSEPVDQPAFRRLLKLYYEDPKRWGLTFQMYVLKERFRQHTLASELVSHGTDVVQDRTIYADGIFGDLVRSDGNMTDDEWSIYADTFGNMKRFLRYPDVIFYLRTTPETCHKRMQRRARSEESGVPLDYLKRLHTNHERAVEALAGFTRVVVLDWEEFLPVEVVVEAVEKVMQEKRLYMRDFNSL